MTQQKHKANGASRHQNTRSAQGTRQVRRSRASAAPQKTTSVDTVDYSSHDALMDAYLTWSGANTANRKVCALCTAR